MRFTILIVAAFLHAALGFALESLELIVQPAFWSLYGVFFGFGAACIVIFSHPDL